MPGKLAVSVPRSGRPYACRRAATSSADRGRHSPLSRTGSSMSGPMVSRLRYTTGFPRAASMRLIGSIWLGGDYGLALLLLGLVVLLVPVVLACISLIRWLVPPSQSSHE